MSTLQKAVNILQNMPETELEAAYTYLLFLYENYPSQQESTTSAFGIAHKYANPDLIGKEEGAYQDAIYKKYVSD